MVLYENEDFLPADKAEKRKYLFLRQKETLDRFLSNGAITMAQYEYSYNGLVTKMNITQKELEDWLKKE